MAYEKTEWKNGDTITAEKLNHMEDGIAEGGGAFIVEFKDDEIWYLKQTFGDVYQNYLNGKMILLLNRANESIRYSSLLTLEIDTTEGYYGTIDFQGCQLHTEVYNSLEELYEAEVIMSD